MTSRRWWHLDPGGIAVGFALAALSVTPSLLPRPALMQGVIAGLFFAIGYGIGAGLWALVRRSIRYRPSRRGRIIAWSALGAAILAASIIFGTLALGWQNEVRRLVEMPAIDGVDVSLFLAGAIPTGILCLAIGRGIRLFTQGLTRTVGAPLATLGAVVMVGLTGFLLVAGAMGAVDAVYASRNGAPDASLTEPGSEFRSAGPQSAIKWEDLGRYGAAFVGGGPSAAEIAEVTGTDAIEPIRVYAGQASAPTLDGRAELAVSELVRTGAFDRSVLVVATTTGSGWLESQAVDAIEYLHAGDTAIVSMQYAYTPSWVSFLFDPDAPVEAARILFDAVEKEWAKRPASERPLLVSYGLSLGAHGSQSVFEGVDDLRERTKGALFVGSPNGTPLWRELQAARDAGTPAWQPVLDGGASVRWVSKASELESIDGSWDAPRVLYLQHATDPVTWLGPELIWSAPEWLEPAQRGDDVSPGMRWIPGITAVQVTIDMLMGESVPARHGHNYGDVMVDGWRAVAGDADLDAGALDRVRALIASYAEAVE